MNNLLFIVDDEDEIVSSRNLLDSSQFRNSINVTRGKSVISQSSSKSSGSGAEVVKESIIVLSSESPGPNLVVSSDCNSVILTTGNISDLQSLLTEEFNLSGLEM